jgi:hypothetical protein
MRSVGIVQNEIENVEHLYLTLAGARPEVNIYLSVREGQQIEQMEESCRKKLQRLHKEKEALQSGLRMDQGFA